MTDVTTPLWITGSFPIWDWRVVRGHDFQKQITVLCRAEQGPALIATGGKVMEISGAVVAMQIGRHRLDVSQDFERCL